MTQDDRKKKIEKLRRKMEIGKSIISLRLGIFTPTHCESHPLAGRIPASANEV